jgi:hypothetical protein
VRIESILGLFNFCVKRYIGYYCVNLMIFLEWLLYQVQDGRLAEYFKLNSPLLCRSWRSGLHLRTCRGQFVNRIAEFQLKLTCNRDREEPRGSSPPTPQYIRITYTAVRQIQLRLRGEVKQIWQTQEFKVRMREGERESRASAEGPRSVGRLRGVPGEIAAYTVRNQLVEAQIKRTSFQVLPDLWLAGNKEGCCGYLHRQSGRPKAPRYLRLRSILSSNNVCESCHQHIQDQDVLHLINRNQKV